MPAPEIMAVAPVPDYAALPHAPALAPAPATLEPSASTVLAVQTTNGFALIRLLLSCILAETIDPLPFLEQAEIRFALLS